MQTVKMKYYLAFIVYALIIIIGAIFHEIWLDEAHHYLLAKNSLSLSDLFYNSRYEGHPLLFDILVWAGCKIYPSVWIMKSINLFFALGTAWLIIFRSPYAFLHIILICAGYFFIYEYAVISRNYSILVFFIFSSLLSYTKGNTALMYFSFVFVILSHFLGLIFVLAFFTFIFLEKGKKQNNSLRIKEFLVPSLILVFGVLIVLLHYPPPDHFLKKFNNPPLISLDRIEKSFSAPIRGMLHIPDFISGNYWSNLLLTEKFKPFATVLAPVIFIFPFLFFRRNLSILAFYFSDLIMLVAFFYFSPLIVAQRHCGFIFILLLCSFWLLQNEHPDYFTQNKTAKTFFLVLSVVNVFSGIVMLSADIVLPFSASEKTAWYIKENFPSRMPVIITHQSTGPPVCAYLERNVYYPETEKSESFCKWNADPFMLTKTQLEARLKKYFSTYPGNSSDTALFLINSHYADIFLKKEFPVNIKEYRFVFLKAFGNSILTSERYRLYYLVKNQSGN